MAAGDIAARNNNLDVQTLLNIFKGAPGGTQTTTSSEQVSDDKAKAYLQQILESNSGLAAVSSGQKAAGMYGSTVNTQLTNDLLARASAQTAALSTTKTATTTTKPAAQMDIGKTLLGLGAGQLLGPVVKAGMKKTGLDKAGQNLADSIFGPSDTSTFVGGGADTTPASILNYSPSSTVPVDTAALSNIDDLTGMKASEAGADSGSGAAGMAGAAVGSAALGSALAGDAAVTGSGYVVGAEGATWAASSAAAAEGAAAFDAAMGTTAAVSAGAEVAGTAAAAGEAAGFGEILTEAAAVLAWIICTELNKQNRLPTRFYRYGAREFLKYDERGKQGYYIWAIPSVRHLRAHPNSMYSKLMELVFNARAEYLAANAGCKGARKTLFGAITTHGLYGFCWVLSRTIARKPYTREVILGA